MSMSPAGGSNNQTPPKFQGNDDSSSNNSVSSSVSSHASSHSGRIARTLTQGETETPQGRSPSSQPELCASQITPLPRQPDKPIPLDKITINLTIPQKEE